MPSQFGGLEINDVEPEGQELRKSAFGGVPVEAPIEPLPGGGLPGDQTFLEADNSPVTLWDRAKNLMKDPDEEGARAVQALVDAESFGIRPNEAMKYRDVIDRGIKINPQAASRNSDIGDRVNQSWETGKKQNFIGEIGYQYITTGDPQYLEKIKVAGLPVEAETFISESRLEDAVRSAAKLMPMVIDTGTESIGKGMKVGMGFGLIATILGQAGPQAALPEEILTVPAATLAGFKIGATSGAFEASLRKEGGLALSEIINFKDEAGQEIDPNIARATAYGIGAINAGIEVAQLRLLINTVPGMSKLFSDATMEVVAGKAVKDKLLALAGKYAGTVAAETAQEVAQESTNIVFEELSKKVNNKAFDTDIEQTDVETVLNRLEATMIESAQGFAVIALPGTVAKAGIAAKGEKVSIDTKPDMEAEPGRIEPVTKLEKTIDKIIEGSFERVTSIEETDIDAEIDSIIAEIEKEDAAEAATAVEIGPKAQAFKDQISQVVEEKEVEAVTTILDARAKAVGMTTDEYIDFHGLEVVKDGSVEGDLAQESEIVFHGTPDASFDQIAKSGELGEGWYFTRKRELAENYSQPRGEIQNLAEATKKTKVYDFDISTLNIKQISKEEYLKDRQILYDEEQKLNGGDWDRHVAKRAEDKLISKYQADGFDGLEVGEELQGVIFRDSFNKGNILNQGKTQTDPTGQPKAMITFQDTKTIIRAFESADVSSLVHELGHVFRRDLGGEDLAITEEWAGVKDGKWDVPAEEKFARGWENYLATGKAPTQELQSVFEKFKQWLSEIYQSIKGSSIDVEITPEIQGVFDRLLIPAESDLATGEGPLSLNQNSEQIDSEAFKKWSGGNDVVSGYDIPDINTDGGKVFKVFHGTTNEFDVFDPTVKGNLEGQFGAVNYFTSDISDADENYAGEGPDLTQRIELRSEQIEHELEDISEEEATEFAEQYNLDFDSETETYPADLPMVLAREELSGGKPETLSLFVKSDNPVYIGGDHESYIENQNEEQYREDATEEVLEENDADKSQIDEYEYEIQERIYEMAQDDVPEVLSALEDAINESGAEVDATQIYQELDIFDPEITATDLESGLRESETMMSAYNEEGELIGSHIIGQVFKNLGYDSIVLQNADQRFSSMNMGGETSHVHVFEETPSNIKSATNNIGTFDPTDPNILKQEAEGPISEEEQNYVDLLESSYNENSINQIRPDVMAEYSAALKKAVIQAEENLKNIHEKEDKVSLRNIKKEAEDIVSASGTFKDWKDAVDEGGLNLETARMNSDKETVNTLMKRRPGLFKKGAALYSENYANRLGFDTADEMFQEWLVAVSRKDAVNNVMDDLIKEYEYFSEIGRDITRSEDLYALEQDELNKIFLKKKPVDRKIKGVIRKITGQVKDNEKTISEREALRESLKRSAMAARKAMALGDKEGVAKEKARYQDIINRAATRRKRSASLKQLKSQIKKELKTSKVKKKGGKPVGKFTPEIQDTLNTLIEVSKLKPAEAERRLADNLERYSDDVPPQEVVIENHFLEMVARLDTMDSIGGLQDLLAEIKALKEQGAMIKALKDFNRSEKTRARVETTVEELGGVPPWVQFTGIKDFTPKKVTELAKRALRTLGKTIMGWDDLMDVLSFKTESKPGESFISNDNNLLGTKNVEKRGTRLAMDKLNADYMKAFDLKKNRHVLRKIHDDNTIDIRLNKVPMTNPIDKTFMEMDLIFTRAELRKRAMELMDPTLEESFKEMGYDENTKAHIFNALTAQDKVFIENQMNFYRDYYAGTNEVYKSIYGVNLPKNDNYTPLMREGITKPVDDGMGEFMKEMSFRATAASAGALKSRVGSILTISKASDISVLERHIAEMEHFKAWAEKIRDLNGVWKNPQVRAAVEINHGKEMLGLVDNFISDIANGSTTMGQKLKGLDKLRINFTKSVLAVNPDVTIKQLTSFVAYAEKMPVAQFTKNLVKFWKNPVKNMEIIYTSELMKARGTNIERDLKAAMQSSEHSAFMKHQSFINMLMLNIQAGDQGAIVIGGWAYYKYLMDKKGMTHDQAIAAFEKFTENTQQSGDITEQSYWQRGGSLAKLVTMFSSSPNQYLRKEIGSVRNFAAGRQGIGQTLKTLIIFHALLPMFFQLVSDRFSWDEDEQKRALIFGALNGWFIMGDGLDFILRKALGMKTFDMEIPIYSIFHDFVKASAIVDLFDLSADEFFRAVRGIAGLAGATTGLPFKQFVDESKGVIDVLDGEYEKGLTEIMGYSPYLAKKLSED